MADEERGPTRTYTNGDIRVFWRPDLCIHSGVCVQGLPGVFSPKRRPWIDIHAAPSERRSPVVGTRGSGRRGFGGATGGSEASLAE